MSKPGLADVKNHLRVDSADDDALITGLIDAAYLKTETYLNADFAVDYVSDFPATVTVAITMLVAVLYEHREAAGEIDLKSMPFGYRFLLESHRNFPTV